MAVPGRGTWETITLALTAGRHLLRRAGCQPGNHSAIAPTDFGMKESGPQQTRSLRPWTFLCSCSAPSLVNPHRLSQKVSTSGKSSESSNCHSNGLCRDRVICMCQTQRCSHYDNCPHCTSNQGPWRVWSCVPQLVISST